jgi:two-component sensor histidine kinase
VRDTENAIRYATLALEVAEENGYRMMSSEMHLRLGAYYQKLKAFELAEMHYREALPYQEEKGIAKALIAAYSNLGLMAAKRNDLAQASYYLDAASPLLSADISDIHKSLYHYASGYVALHNGNLKASRQAFEHVLNIGNASGTDSIRIDGYAGLLEVHRRLRNFETALAYSDSLKALNTQLDLAFQNNTMLDLESKYETNIKNTEIANLSAIQEVQTLQLAQRHKHLMYTIIGLILALAALSAFWFAFATKSRSNIRLEVKIAQLSEALANNKMLVKEIHHRVKNNLQVVSSLLNLQSRFETDNTVLRAINSGKYRVQSMSLLHQNLYLNEDLHSVTVKKYFEELAKYLVKGYPLNGKEVNLTLDIEDITLDVDTVVPMGLICNELITNALKYAYPRASNCELFVGLKEAHGKIRLVVKDNGIGTPFTELPEKSTSMGTQLIKSFAHKLKATIEIDNFEGTEVKLTFERTEHKTAISRLKNVAS